MLICLYPMFNKTETENSLTVPRVKNIEYGLNHAHRPRVQKINIDLMRFLNASCVIIGQMSCFSTRQRKKERV